MRSKIFHASVEFMLWLSSSHLTEFDFLDLAESVRYGVYKRRQLHNRYAVYWNFISPDINPSVSYKRRYGNYCPFYTIQAWKFVTARFCYKSKLNSRRYEDNRLNIDFSLLYKVFYSVYKDRFCWCEHSLSLYLSVLSCLFLCSVGAPNMVNH